jgi:uncharacterized protein (TIGR02452 family)
MPRTLKQVWSDTVKQSNEMENPPKSIKFGFIDIPQSEPEYQTEIIVENKDTFDMAQDFLNLGLNPVALNMACETYPGGGVKYGAKAQEEDLFRRSNYFLTMPKSFYPLKGPQLIYSPKITVFKNTDYQNIKPFQTACIASAALKRPRLNDHDQYNVAQYHIMYHKIENIFRVALLKGHDSLVLGALGCGAYGNPVYQVIEIFNQILERYYGYFKQIGFAVMSSRDDNYEIFSKNINRFYF